MKFLAILLIAISVVCIQAQGPKNGAKNDQNAVPLPINLVPTTIKILQDAPPSATRTQVNSAISERPTTIAGAVSIFAPDFAPVISTVAGFNIPLNADLFVQKMKKVLKSGQFDKLTILKTIMECTKTPPSGQHKEMILSLMSKFMDSIAPVLPGLTAVKAEILQAVDKNNTKPNGVTNPLLKFVGRIPIVGRLLKYAGKHVCSAFVSGFDGWAAYRDDPMPILNALFHMATSSKSRQHRIWRNTKKIKIE